MTVGTVKTQGTHAYFIDKTTTSDTDLVKLACPTGVTGLGGAKDQIETTCLDTTGDKEFVGGLGNPGQVSVPFNLIPREHSHQILFDLKASGDVLEWYVGLSESETAPTVNDDQTFAVPTDRSGFTFAGYIADVNIDIATNEIVRGTLTLQRSGNVTFHPYTPA